jgi:hypothetical protein
MTLDLHRSRSANSEITSKTEMDECSDGEVNSSERTRATSDETLALNDSR